MWIQIPRDSPSSPLFKQDQHELRSRFKWCGGRKVIVIAVQVEKLLHHPDGAAGAQTAHDAERKQQAFPAA